MKPNKIIEYTSNSILVVSALISIAISICGIFFDMNFPEFFNKIPQINLFILGILSLSFGVERIVFEKSTSSQIDSIELNLDKLNKQLANVLEAQFIDDGCQTLEVAKEIVSEAQDQIYVVSFDVPKNDQVNTESKIYKDIQDLKDDKIFQPEIKCFYEYFVELLNVMKNRENFDFRIVFCSDGEKLNDNSIEKLKVRKKFFESYGIASKSRFKYRTIPIGFTFILIDYKYMLISFPSIYNDPIPRNTIKITNNVKLLKSISKWYENSVWEDAEDL